MRIKIIVCLSSVHGHCRLIITDHDVVYIAEFLSLIWCEQKPECSIQVNESRNSLSTVYYFISYHVVYKVDLFGHYLVWAVSRLRQKQTNKPLFTLQLSVSGLPPY